jgi:hypothetical protein
MPKKTTKKKQYVWGWAATNTPGKPSDAEKAKVTAAFAPWVQQLKDTLPPLKEPQVFNQATDVFSKWRGSYFYVMCYYKCPKRPERIAEGFETGLARLAYKSPDCYDVAYFRHTGQWFTFLFDLTLEQALDEVQKNSLFMP